MAIAACMEFAGSVSVGARVADTIRTKIVDPHLYDNQPAVLLLAMMCTIIASSLFLTIATRYSLPVSTTHSIVGGIVGAATASVGIHQVNWGWRGVSQVFAAWAIAPGISGTIGAILFLITKHFVMTRRRAVRYAFMSIPIYTFITVGSLASKNEYPTLPLHLSLSIPLCEPDLLTLSPFIVLVVWKGIQLDVELSGVQITISVLSVAVGVTALQAIFVLPYLWCRIMREDWRLRWRHILQGPFLLKRPPPPPPPPGMNSVKIRDYYQGHLTLEELECVRASRNLLQSIQSSHSSDLGKGDCESLASPLLQPPPAVDGIPPRPPGPWYNGHVFLWRLKRIIFHGLEQDVIKMQKRSAVLNWNIEDMHARAPRYDNRAEFMYSALQILTAASASFIHGANDVANAIAPFTTAYLIWQNGKVESRVPVPVWVL